MPLVLMLVCKMQLGAVDYGNYFILLNFLLDISDSS